MSFNFILLFSMTVFVASIIPGPSMLLALTHGMHYGAKKTAAIGKYINRVVGSTFIGAGIGLAASNK